MENFQNGSFPLSLWEARGFLSAFHCGNPGALGDETKVPPPPRDWVPCCSPLLTLSSLSLQPSAHPHSGFLAQHWLQWRSLPPATCNAFTHHSAGSGGSGLLSAPPC